MCTTYTTRSDIFLATMQLTPFCKLLLDLRMQTTELKEVHLEIKQPLFRSQKNVILECIFKTNMLISYKNYAHIDAKFIFLNSVCTYRQNCSRNNRKKFPLRVSWISYDLLKIPIKALRDIFNTIKVLTTLRPTLRFLLFFWYWTSYLFVIFNMQQHLVYRNKSIIILNFLLTSYYRRIIPGFSFSPRIPLNEKQKIE